MTVKSVVVGATSDTTARVTVKVTGTSVSLAVQDAPTLDAVVLHGPVTPNAQGVATITVTGLMSGTNYWFAVEEGVAPSAVRDTNFPGRFRTLPTANSQASFTIGVSGCSGAYTPVDVVNDGTVLDPLNVSNHPVFDTIRTKAHAENWSLFADLGDLFYYNLGQDHPATEANYRQAYDDVLLQPRVHQLFREVPLVYVWDDHDFGPNNSNGTFTEKWIAQQVYRERVPHYPVPALAAEKADSPIYQEFKIGRVQFIISDTRSSRAPNSTPEGPDKTMLGGVQKDWMRRVLTDTTAEFFVWLTPTPWITSGTDTWGGYAAEANELVAMFTELGFINRMIAVTSDTHYHAIDMGTSGVTYGGIPLYVFGSLDSGNSGSSLPYDTGPVSGGKDRYGTIKVVDNGDTIHVTGAGWIGATLWREHTVTVSVAVEGAPPAPAPVPEPDTPFESTAIRRQSVTWLGCDLVSGRIIAELPEMRGTVSRVLGEYTSAALTLPIPHGGPGSFSQGGQSLAHVWEQATVPGQTMIVPVVNDVPAAGFIVLQRSGGNTSAELQLACVSLEGYLERRYVNTHFLLIADEAKIFKALVGDANIEGVNLVVDAPLTGMTRNRVYVARDDGTVYQRLQELMAVQGGPEWTIDVDWADEKRQSIKKIARLRKRIGMLRPGAVFSTEGEGDVAYTYTEDYTDGKGANHVVATSSGEGEDRPESSPIDDVLVGWPRYERRISPSTSITSSSVLNEHAISELALRRDGARTWELTKPWNAYPRLGIDWKLGDSVPLELTGARHPFGVETTVRTIGWTLDMQAGTVQPIMLEVD